MIQLVINDEEPTQEDREMYSQLAHNLFYAYMAHREGILVATTERKYKSLGGEISNVWIGLAQITSDVAQVVIDKNRTEAEGTLGVVIQ